MGAKSFQELICWQLARELRQILHRLIDSHPFRRNPNLASQLQRAARSVTGNIAEGFASRSHAEFARFLKIASRSIHEIEDRLIEAVDSKLMTAADAAPAFSLAKRTSVAIARLIAYLRRTP